jgi:cell division protein ZapA (FtsZ GTPase activity inhibitor)
MSEEIREPVSITIGDQTFRVRIAPGERERFARGARLANATLQEILDDGVVGGPRALAMTLFQLALELEDTRDALRAVRSQRDERLRRLINRLGEALDAHLGI